MGRREALSVVFDVGELDSKDILGWVWKHMVELGHTDAAGKLVVGGGEYPLLSQNSCPWALASTLPHDM